MTTTGILIFNDVEELDFVGPWEVLTMGKMVRPEDRVVSIGLNKGEVKCHKGLRVMPDYTLEDAPALDVLLIPGGDGTRPLLRDERLTAWIKARAASATWVTSVCSGALLLANAGLLDGRKATTHWFVLEELRRFSKVQVMEHVRYVRDENVVTAAGVSAGIDMALWLFGQLGSPEQARFVQRAMQYDPAPPYQAIA